MVDQLSGKSRTARQNAPGPENDVFDLQRDQSALEWERLRIERQRLALEIRIKRRDVAAGKNSNILKEALGNPVIVTIVGGVLTLLTAIITNLYNSSANRETEALRARIARETADETLQSDLIKKFVETPDKGAARENLQFLVDAGLLPKYADSIRRYLAANPGAAPQIGGRGPLVGGIVGLDDRAPLDRAAPAISARFQGIGKIVSTTTHGKVVCSAFLAAPGVVVTPAFCLTDTPGDARNAARAKEASFEPWRPPGTSASPSHPIDLSGMKIAGAVSSPAHSIAIAPLQQPHPPLRHLAIDRSPPMLNQPLALGFFAIDRDEWVYSGGDDCRVIRLTAEEIHHLCDTDPGVSGAPVVAANGRVVGLHVATGKDSKHAIRIDAILKDPKIAEVLGQASSP